MTEQEMNTFEERARARLTELREIQSALQQQLAACGAVIAELEVLLGERTPEGQDR